MNDASADALEQALDAAPPGPIKRGNAPPDLVVRPFPLQLIRYAAEEWLAIAVLAWAAATAPLLAYPLFGLLLAGRYHALGVVLHDAAHLPLPGGRKSLSLRVVELLAGYPVASTVDALRFHHLRHHRDSGMASDPYFKPALEHSTAARFLAWARGAILLPFWTVRGPFGALAALVPSLRGFYARVFLQDRSGDLEVGSHPEVIRCAQEEIGQCLFFIGVVAAASVWPRFVLLGYVIPAVAAGLLASYRLLWEHNFQPCTDRQIETLIASTRDHHTGLVNKLFLAPRNVGYHLVHHLHPQAGISSLPALYAWYRRTYPEKYPRAHE